MYRDAMPHQFVGLTGNPAYTEVVSTQEGKVA